jgi:hypothetical protein
LNNIYALFPVLKKHDDELIKLTNNGNKYTKSDTLDDLLDGTLTQTYINDLVALVLSNLKISAISCAVLGQPLRQQLM